jgi:hypothetical protein
MRNSGSGIIFFVAVLCVLTFRSSFAGEVEILSADFVETGKHRWSVNVTLKHGDTGWDHYADNWRVVDDQGNILGDRVLYHPHVDEQPFTRGLNNVFIPEGMAVVFIEAHDKVHGWSKNRLRVELGDVAGGRLSVEAE